MATGNVVPIESLSLILQMQYSCFVSYIDSLMG